MNISFYILIANIIVSVSCFQNRDLFFKLDFQPYLIDKKKQWYRFISHAFVHADGFHLIVNMYVLYHFGKLVEHQYAQLFGAMWVEHFILLYLGGMLFSAIPGYARNRANYNYHGVGASGAVSALVFAFILIEPLKSLTLVFLPFFGLPAWIFGLLYLVYEIYMDRNKKSPIAHSAHYFGAIFGVLYTAAMKPELILRFLP
jgi:membrane associated rhomboid family serine protease